MVRPSLLWVWSVGCAVSTEPAGEGTQGTEPPPAPPTTEVILEGRSGDPGLGSADALVFGPAGHLVLGDGALDRVLVFETGDWQPDPLADDFDRVANLPVKVADALGVEEDDVSIEDIEVNPLSGRVYVAVERFDVGWSGVLTVQPDGSLAVVDLAARW
jgi:hypothetical protein